MGNLKTSVGCSARRKASTTNEPTAHGKTRMKARILTDRSVLIRGIDPSASVAGTASGASVPDIAHGSDGARGRMMKTMRRWRHGCVMGLGLTLAVLTGCQTWTPGMTLPSPHYLHHPPQYFPESPPFPLTPGLATMDT